MIRLKPKEVRRYRERFLKENPVCGICGTAIKKEDAVLDHCHNTGHIREVLHRNCNQIEGRVLSWCSRNGKGVPPEKILQGILNHWNKDFSHNPIHPTHLTDTEKEIKKLRAKVRKVKLPKTKEKYLNQIKELQCQK